MPELPEPVEEKRRCGLDDKRKSDASHASKAIRNRLELAIRFRGKGWSFIYKTCHRLTGVSARLRGGRKRFLFNVLKSPDRHVDISS